MIEVENYFLIVLALVWIVAAVIQDLRKREVANWWNFSLIAIALSYRAFVSVQLWDYLYFVYGLVGFGIFFLLAHVFYYGRLFAGGDAKLLMALGCVLPFSLTFFQNLLIFLYFLVLLLFCGSIYGLLYSVVLSYKNKKEFSREFLKQLHESKKFFFIFIMLAAVILIFVLFIKIYLFIWFSLIILLFPFLYAYAKAIEESCMIKKVAAKELTIGDWLYKSVRIGKKTIKPNWEGLNEEELKVLQKTRKKILIKQGIPFTPSFLFAFLALIWILRNSLWSFWQFF